MGFDYKNQPDEFWKKHLKGDALHVCRLKGTEKPGSGKYDHFYERGTYYCAACGGDYPLYSSETKYDSGSGWPSFYQPIKGSVEERPDEEDRARGFWGGVRTEVLCARCGSHLGHVFDDGPNPTGKRYCMNSAALSFVPLGAEVKRSYEVEGEKLEGEKLEDALFAMGCFWCADHAFRGLEGVSVKCGYAGGTKPNPTYEAHEGYREALLVTFDPKKVSYKELLSVFWRNIDPFDDGGQFYDRGFSYTTAIYYRGDMQEALAEQSKRDVEGKLKTKISVPILAATTFYEAEEYHQGYALKNPVRYEAYRCASGREEKLKSTWE